MDKHRTKTENNNLVPGINPVKELLENRPDKIDSLWIKKGKKTPDTDRILDLCKEHSIRFHLVDDAMLSRITKYTQHQGVIAQIKEVETITFEDLLINATQAPLPLIVALDTVQDPGNIGTLARTLYALGGAGLVVPTHNSAHLGTAAKKSSAGALEYLPVAQVVNLSRAIQLAEDNGFYTYTTGMIQKDLKQEILNPLSQKLHLPALLVLGNEEKGVRPLVAKNCMYSLNIPMLRPFDSLNVAQAGGILISTFLQNHII